MQPRPAHADDLGAALDAAWHLLAQGVTGRRHPFHTPALATLGRDGAPRARILVLRGSDPSARVLRLHTDRRAAKWEELSAEPRCALHFYDAEAAVQLRLTGRASLHSDDQVADAAWAASRDFSRRCYAIELAPGTPIAAPPPAPQDEAAGRGAFGVVQFRVETLEWLWLAAEGHRRARFAWGDQGALEATWLVP
jgi:hypothetical protein